MLVEVKITYDPGHETFEQALASINRNSGIGDNTSKVSNVYGPNAYAAPQSDKPEEKPEDLPGQMSIEDVKSEAQAEKQKQVTKTDIRAIATAVSKAGKKAELKAALESFGATKLSDVNEADYPALKEKLEAINA